MRILYLTQWYTPELVWVEPELAETLRAMGHDITVLTGFPNYPQGKLYPGYRIRPWQKERINGVPVIRVPLFPDHSNSAIKRSLNFISFTLFATILGPLLARRSDVVYVTYPPVIVGVPAWLLSRLWRVPLVSEIQDMWPETLSSTGFVSNPLILRVIGDLAQWLYRRTAAFRVITPGFRVNLIEKGVESKRIHVVPNWVDSDLIRPSVPDQVLAERLGLAGRFNILYAGAHGPAQDLSNVLKAAELVRDLPEVQFVFVGDGIELDHLQQTVKDRDLGNVKFLGRYPIEMMSSLYALADVLLHHLRDDPLFRITIPSKTYAYMAAGKPILAAVAGDTADAVEAASAGLMCPPGDPQALADTVRRFYAMPKSELDNMGRRGREAACRDYQRQHLVGEIAQVLEQVAAAS